MGTTAKVDPYQALDGARRTLTDEAAASEAGYTLTPAAMEALRGSGLLRMWVPNALGGWETDPLTALSVFEETARIDGAAGWILSNCSFIASACQVLPDACVEELFSTPDSVVCGSFVPPGTAEALDNGYRVTGRYSFGSGSQYADWLASLAVIMDGGAPRPGPDGGPTLAIVATPASDAKVLDTWRTLGMRGTGSHDYTLSDCFVPAHRAFLLAPWSNPARAFSGPLYRMGPWLDGVRIAATALGIARGALDDFVALSGSKTPAYTQAVLADRGGVQDRAARARALIDAGHSYLHAAVSDAWQVAREGARINAETGLPVGLSATFGLEAAVKAGDLLYELAGSTAFRDESPVQRRFRDLQTLRQNAIASTARYESLGKLMLGRQSDWAFHYL